MTLSQLLANKGLLIQVSTGVKDCGMSEGRSGMQPRGKICAVHALAVRQRGCPAPHQTALGTRTHGRHQLASVSSPPPAHLPAGACPPSPCARFWTPTPPLPCLPPFTGLPPAPSS
jgi:hypothetical protein